MASRREFLQIGIAATALPLATKAIRAAELPAVEPVRLYKVIYDRRFAEGIAFGERAGMLGLPVHAIDGDMTHLWYDDLYHQWRKAPAAIAGLTGRGALFCFEQLARDQRMRVVFRAAHRRAAGRIEHDVTGPVTMVRDTMALAAQWAGAMAEIVAACPSGRTEIAHAGAGAWAAFDDDALYSWVIAPAVRA